MYLQFVSAIWSNYCYIIKINRPRSMKILADPLLLAETHSAPLAGRTTKH